MNSNIEVFLDVGNNNNNGNNMNMIMFTPMNGRRSTIMQRKGQETCQEKEELEMQLSQIAIDSIRFYVKFSHNPDLDIDKYYLDNFANGKYKDHQVAKLIMKHVLNGIKNLNSAQQDYPI